MVFLIQTNLDQINQQPNPSVPTLTMNAILKKYLAFQTEFFAKMVGQVRPVLPGDHRQYEERYSVTMNTCVECYLEKGWSQKLGEILVRHGISLDKFLTVSKSIGFSVREGELQFTYNCCPKVSTILNMIAGLMPDE